MKKLINLIKAYIKHRAERKARDKANTQIAKDYWESLG